MKNMVEDSSYELEPSSGMSAGFEKLEDPINYHISEDDCLDWPTNMDDDDEAFEERIPEDFNEILCMSEEVLINSIMQTNDFPSEQLLPSSNETEGKVELLSVENGHLEENQSDKKAEVSAKDNNSTESVKSGDPVAISRAKSPEISSLSPVEHALRPSRRKKKRRATPKRPLSAYNFFFQKERRKIFRQESKRRVGFEELGKVIGKRWQILPLEDRKKYEKLSAIDIARYRDEMEVFDQKRRKQIGLICSRKNESNLGKSVSNENDYDSNDDTCLGQTSEMKPLTYRAASPNLLRTATPCSESPNDISEEPSPTTDRMKPATSSVTKIASEPSPPTPPFHPRLITCADTPIYPAAPNRSGIVDHQYQRPLCLNISYTNCAPPPPLIPQPPYMSYYPQAPPPLPPPTYYNHNSDYGDPFLPPSAVRIQPPTPSLQQQIYPGQMTEEKKEPMQRFEDKKKSCTSFNTEVRYAPASFAAEAMAFLPPTAKPVDAQDAPMAIIPGMEVLLSDPYGVHRRYKVEYKCYKMTRAEADAYMENLQNPPSRPCSSMPPPLDGKPDCPYQFSAPEYKERENSGSTVDAHVSSQQYMSESCSAGQSYLANGTV